jgi:hypothetical protein
MTIGSRKLVRNLRWLRRHPATFLLFCKTGI